MKEKKHIHYFPSMRKITEKSGVPVLYGTDAEFDAGTNPAVPLPVNIRIVPVEQITDWLDVDGSEEGKSKE